MRASVIIPAYERIEPLVRALDTVVEQDFPRDEFEIIVSDDGSGPAVEECVRAYGSRGASVRFVRGPNAGPGVARNRGADIARGDVLAFVDSDCTAPHEWLRTIVGAAEQHGAVYGPVSSPLPAIPPFVHGFDLDGTTKMGAGNFAVRRELFAKIGGFDPAVSYLAEDWDIASRLRETGTPPVFIPEARIIHPLRVNDVTSLRARLRNEVRSAKTLHVLCDRTPAYRDDIAALNRRAASRAAVKTALILSFLPAAAVFPPALLGSCAVGVAVALTKRRAANRALRSIGERLSVPLSTAVRWGVQWPVHELLTCAARVTCGVAFLTSQPVRSHR